MDTLKDMNDKLIEKQDELLKENTKIHRRLNDQHAE